MSSTAKADCVIEAQSEVHAVAVAAECDQRVEVIEARTPFEQLFAEPDGTMTLESAVEPQRVRRSDGSWADVDATLTARSDGRLAPMASLADVTFSAGGADPLVRASGDNGSSFVLDWPGELPVGQVDGDSIRYPNVLPDVDLVIRATVRGFNHVLVVKTPEAAANPAVQRVRFDLGGDVEIVATADGGLRVFGGGKTMLTAPAAVMWDSTSDDASSRATTVEPDVEGPGDGAKTAPVAIELEPDAVTLIPDADLLAADDTVFPIHIDPEYASDPSRWVYANDQNTDRGADPTAASARVGLDPSNGWLFRSLFTFPVGTLKGKVVTSAKFQIDLYHSWTCQGDERNVYLYRSTYPDSTTRVSWSKATLGSYIGADAVASNKDACPTPDEPSAVWANAALLSNVQSAADNYKTITFAMSAKAPGGGNESDQARWKKFRQSTAKLVTSYNSVPGVPTSMTVGGTACSVDGVVVVNDVTPELTAKLPDADGTDMLTGNVEYRMVGGTSTTVTDTNVQAGQRSSVVTSSLVDGSEYEWRVQGRDQHGATSPWTNWCRFAVDVAIPAAPSILSDDFQPCTDVTCPVAGTPGETGSFTVTAVDDDVVTYRYGWSAPPVETVSTVNGASRVIAVTPPKYGENTFFVETVDAGGNHSSTASFTFVVDRASSPSSGWTLEKRPGAENDALTNIAASGPALVPTGSVGWSADARLIDVDSATFSGGGYETGQTLVRTDGSFSVSAWVRMDGPTDHGTVVAQAAQNRPSFYLKFNTTKKRWGFEMPSADVASPTWHQAFSVAEPAYGVWTHLTGVLDRAENVMRLYVNGRLESEITAPASWHVDGDLAVGFASDTAGTTWSPFNGAIGQVRIFDRVVVGEDFTVGPDDHGPILKPELVGRWSFDEDWGTTAVDDSDWNRDLTLFGGSSFGPGRDLGSYGLELDGVTGYAATDGPVFRTDDSFSVSAWARMDGKTLDFTVVASEAVHRPSTYLKYKPSTDRWRVTIPDADVADPGWFIAEDTVSPDIGEWYHLAAVYDAAVDELRLYVNGELRAVSAGPTTPWHVDGRLLIGAAASQAGTEAWSFADGGIDDVAVYQSVLTDDQVVALSDGVAV